MTAAGLGDIISLRGLALALPLAAGVLLFGFWRSSHAKSRKRKPGQYLAYIAPGKTAAGCRALLGKAGPDDIFSYTLNSVPAGGWLWHLTLHNPTGQLLDTRFMLQFEDEEPARLSLTFAGEAFGMREPVMGEEMLDEFFKAKLGAERLPHFSVSGHGEAPGA